MSETKVPRPRREKKRSSLYRDVMVFTTFIMLVAVSTTFFWNKSNEDIAARNLATSNPSDGSGVLENFDVGGAIPAQALASAMQHGIEVRW
jgi:hypothetical protein